MIHAKCFFVLGAGIAVFATGDLSANLIVRDYIELVGAGSYTQTGTEVWTFRRGNHTGALLSPDTVGFSGDLPGGWNTPGAAFNVPATGYLTNTGNAAGLAVAPTFDGIFAHPGSGVPVLLVYTVQAGDDVIGTKFSGEMPFNSASGNGIGISVAVVDDGNLINVQNNVFDASNPLIDWNVDLSAFDLDPGDQVVFDLNDRGSYLFDQGNVSAEILVPTPGTFTGLAVGGLMMAGRRRRK